MLAAPHPRHHNIVPEFNISVISVRYVASLLQEIILLMDHAVGHSDSFLSFDPFDRSISVRYNCRRFPFLYIFLTVVMLRVGNDFRFHLKSSHVLHHVLLTVGIHYNPLLRASGSSQGFYILSGPKIAVFNSNPVMSVHASQNGSHRPRPRVVLWPNCHMARTVTWPEPSHGQNRHMARRFTTCYTSRAQRCFRFSNLYFRLFILNKRSCIIISHIIHILFTCICFDLRHMWRHHILYILTVSNLNI